MRTRQPVEVALERVHPEDVKDLEDAPANSSLALRIESCADLQCALNSIYCSSPLIRGNSSIYKICVVGPQGFRRVVHKLWMLPGQPTISALQCRMRRDTLVFKLESSVGIWTRSMRAARIYESKSSLTLRAILTSPEDPDWVGAVLEDTAKENGGCYIQLFAPSKEKEEAKRGPSRMMPVPEELSRTLFAREEAQGYDFFSISEGEGEFVALVVRNEVLLFSLASSSLCCHKPLRSESAKLTKHSGRMLLLEGPGAGVMELRISRKPSDGRTKGCSDRSGLLEEKRAKKYYVMSQLIRRIDAGSELLASYRDAMDVSEIIRNGLSPVELEYLLLESSGSNKLISSIFDYVKLEINALLELTMVASNPPQPRESVLVSTLTGYVQPERVDFLGVTIRLLLHRGDFLQVIELYTLLLRRLKALDWFYIAEQLAGRFLEHIPHHHALDSRTMPKTWILPNPEESVVLPHTKEKLPRFVGMLDGADMVRCYLLLQLEAYMEVMEMLESVEMRELQVELIKGFVNEVKEKLREEQRHGILRVAYRIGIMNKDFL